MIHLRNYPIVFTGRDCGKPRKTSFMLDSLRAKIMTVYLHFIPSNKYWYIIFFGDTHFRAWQIWQYRNIWTQAIFMEIVVFQHHSIVFTNKIFHTKLPDLSTMLLFKLHILQWIATVLFLSQRLSQFQCGYNWCHRGGITSTVLPIKPEMKLTIKADWWQGTIQNAHTGSAHAHLCKEVQLITSTSLNHLIQGAAS
jgi:hypothetical protein